MVAACETLSFMGGQRLVMVKNAHLMSKADLDMLADYLSSPSPQTTLVVVSQTATKGIAKTTKFYKRAKVAGLVQEFPALREYEVGNFLVKQARSRGLNFSREAMQALIAAVGADLAALDNAVEKVDLYLGPRDGIKDVDESELAEIVAVTRTHEIWDLTDAIAKKDALTAMGLLDGMLERGQAGVGINLMVARQMRQLLQVKSGQAKGMPKQGIMSAAGMAAWAVDRFGRDARRFSAEELRTALEVTLETDRKLKSSRLPDRVWLEHMILELCSGGGESRPQRRG